MSNTTNSMSSNHNNNNNIESLGKQTWEALGKLHGESTAPHERSKADQFLSKYLPNQHNCWHIFAKYLSTENVPHAAHFFAANMLRSKIQRNLHEVPREHHQGLHDMIMKALIRFNGKGDQYENVRTQLSIALALLNIQRTDWTEQVKHIIDELAKTQTLDILLNILTRLPEELYTFHIPVSPKIKHIASNNLRNHASYVLKLLHQLFQAVETNNLPNKIPIKLKILKCFAAWLDFMDDHFKDYMKNYTILTKVCFDSLQNDELFKEACTCISKILRLSDGDTRNLDYNYYDDNNNADEEDEPHQEHKNGDHQSEMDELMRKQFNILVPTIISLRSMYSKAMEENDREKCHGLTRLFVDTAEHYVDWIINATGNKQAEQLINIILDCSRHPEPEVSTYVCTFWDKLFYPFICMAKEFRRKYPDIRETYDEFPRPWPDWAKPYVSSQPQGLIPTIIPNIVDSAKLPMEYEDLDRDEQEDATRLRWQLSDSVMDICKIIGLKSVLSILSNLLQPFCSNERQQLNGSIHHYNNYNWSEQELRNVYKCEAILFCVQSAYRCDSIDKADTEHPLNRIFQQLSFLPLHVVVRRTAIKLIAAHSNFIDPRQQIFGYLYNYILSGLDEPRLQSECVRAICEFCERFEANEVARNFILSLFNIYDEKSYNLHTRDQLILIEAITMLISTFNNLEDCERGIRKLLQKPQQHLQKLLKQERESKQQSQIMISFTNGNPNVVHAKPQSRDHEDVSVEGISLYHTMNCISCMFKYFNPKSTDNDEQPNNSKNISVQLLEEFWNDIKYVLVNYTDSDGIMEKTTRIIKHVIRNGGAMQFMQSKLCIESLQLMTCLYCTKSQRSSFLYIIWTYVDEYICKDRNADNELLATLSKITQCTFHIIHNEETFRDKADIVEDFYELLSLYLKKAPHLLIQNESFLKEIFERAIYGIVMDQHRAHDAICNFYAECLYVADYRDDDNENQKGNANSNRYAECMHELFMQFGPEIVHRILRGIGGEVKYDRAEKLSDLLNRIFKYDKTLIEQFVRHNMQKHMQHINCQDPTKDEFMNQFFDYQNDRRKRFQACMDWSAACDRYLRSRTF